MFCLIGFVSNLNTLLEANGHNIPISTIVVYQSFTFYHVVNFTEYFMVDSRFICCMARHMVKSEILRRQI